MLKKQTNERIKVRTIQLFPVYSVMCYLKWKTQIFLESFFIFKEVNLSSSCAYVQIGPTVEAVTRLYIFKGTVEFYVYVETL